MLRLLKYLKPYWLLIVLDIALLFGQAMADLALPDYMSKIVNVGIQQGGIETLCRRRSCKARWKSFSSLWVRRSRRSSWPAIHLIDQNSPDYRRVLWKSTRPWPTSRCTS